MSEVPLKQEGRAHAVQLSIHMYSMSSFSTGFFTLASQVFTLRGCTRSRQSSHIPSPPSSSARPSACRHHPSPGPGLA